MELIVILHNIRSTHNVGSILRTADAAGVSRIIFSGYTPLPVNRFGIEQKEIAKTALGAHRFIPWKKTATLSREIQTLKSNGYLVVALEQDKESVDYRELAQNKKIVCIVGNEVRGLSKPLLKQCDVIAEIPMRGKKESLNVAVATGIFLFSVGK